MQRRKNIHKHFLILKTVHHHKAGWLALLLGSHHILWHLPVASHPFDSHVWVHFFQLGPRPAPDTEDQSHREKRTVKQEAICLQSTYLSDALQDKTNKTMQQQESGKGCARKERIFQWTDKDNQKKSAKSGFYHDCRMRNGSFHLPYLRATKVVLRWISKTGSRRESVVAVGVWILFIFLKRLFSSASLFASQWQTTGENMKITRGKKAADKTIKLYS